MSKCKRETEIIQQLVRSHFISPKALAELLGVSIATVRRDIELLEDDGIILKKPGGICLSPKYTPPTTAQYQGAQILKERIGAAAARLVDDNDTIFIGPGRTCLSLANNLIGKKKLQVITNSFEVTHIFSGNPNIRVISCGGDVYKDSWQKYTTGQYAINTINSVYIGKVFLTVDYLSETSGCFINHPELTSFFRHILSNSSSNIVLVDKTKFSVPACRLLCPIGLIQTYVTNPEAPASFLQYAKANDIQVILA